MDSSPASCSQTSRISSIAQFGGPLASSLLDPRYQAFALDPLEGFVGYRSTWGAVVALGDPVCAPSTSPALARAFLRTHCRRPVVFASASRGFAAWALAEGMAAVRFGREVVLDPTRDPFLGSAGANLRNKVKRSARCGVTIREYRSELGIDAALEAEIRAVGDAWVRARRGLQMFAARLDMFVGRGARRYFIAVERERVVGALVLTRMAARDGWLIDVLVHSPEASPGTSEALVVAALAAVAAAGAREVSFGVATTADLGEMEGLGPTSRRVARIAFGLANRRFHLGGRLEFREKFVALRTEDAFLVFSPPRVTLRALLAIGSVFNVSLPRHAVARHSAARAEAAPG